MMWPRALLLPILCAPLFAIGATGPANASAYDSSAWETHTGNTLLQYDLATSYVADSSDAHGGYALYTSPTPDFTLPVILSAPVPGFASATWEADGMTETEGGLKFFGGMTTASYPLEFDLTVGGHELAPGLMLWFGRSHLFVSSNSPLELGTIRDVEILLAEGTPAHLCWVIFVTAVEAFIGHIVPFGDPAAAARGEAWVTSIQRYRDEILATTPAGQYYIDLYDQYSVDMVMASLAAPDVLARMLRARNAWAGAIAALVAGGRTSAAVTQEMQDDLNDVLDQFAAHGSPALASVVSTERQKLQLDAIVGLDMTQQLQTQIETLGGPSAVEEQSWGRVKSLYR